MDTREQIIETAQRLFVTRGSKVATMDEVAAEAGVSKRTLYELFEDKEHLLSECIRWNNQKSRDAFACIGKDAENVIDALLKIRRFQSMELHKVKFDFFLELKRFYPQVYRETVERMTDERKEHMKMFFSRGQQEGLFIKNINVNLICDISDIIMLGIHENGWKIVDKYSGDECFLATVLYFIRGLCTEEGVKYIDNYYN